MHLPGAAGAGESGREMCAGAHVVEDGDCIHVDKPLLAPLRCEVGEEAVPAEHPMCL